jgi:hypothetical protein
MATSDSIETGGPAFPLPFPHKQVHYVPMRDGMTLRDYFAAQALAAMKPRFTSTKDIDDLLPTKLADKAYEIADAMLKAREVKHV